MMKTKTMAVVLAIAVMVLVSSIYITTMNEMVAVPTGIAASIGVGESGRGSSKSEPATGPASKTEKTLRPYVGDKLRVLCDRRGYDHGQALARLSDLMREFPGKPGVTEYDEWIEQIDREMHELVVEPCKDMGAAIETVRSVVRTKDPSGPILILAVMAQDHVLEFLDSTVYLGFKGRSGAGKGTALECAILLARDGQVLSVTTPADLSAALAEGRAIGIPEADSLAHKEPIVAKILRDGYRRGNVYGFMVPVNGKEWKRETRSLFGVKVFDFHVSFDAHVIGRSIILEMEIDYTADLAMDAEKKSRRLAPVRAFLIREAERAKREWTKEKADALWDDPEFRADVKALGGKTGRDHVCGANLLLVSRILGWDLQKELRRAMRGRRTLDDLSEESEVADAIREIAERDGPVSPAFELRTEALLLYLNDRRTRLKLKTFTPQGLGSILADLGFKRDKDLVRATSGPNRDKNVLLPTEFLKELTQPAQPAQMTLKQSGYPDEKPEKAADAPAAPVAPDTPQTPAPDLNPVMEELDNWRVMEEADNWTVPPKDRARPKGGES